MPLDDTQPPRDERERRANEIVELLLASPLARQAMEAAIAAASAVIVAGLTGQPLPPRATPDALASLDRLTDLLAKRAEDGA